MIKFPSVKFSRQVFVASCAFNISMYCVLNFRMFNFVVRTDKEMPKFSQFTVIIAELQSLQCFLFGPSYCIEFQCLKAVCLVLVSATIIMFYIVPSHWHYMKSSTSILSLFLRSLSLHDTIVIVCSYLRSRLHAVSGHTAQLHFVHTASGHLVSKWVGSKQFSQLWFRSCIAQLYMYVFFVRRSNIEAAFVFSK